MIAPPLALTAMLRLCAGPSLPSTDSVVAGPQLLLPAGRTASVVSPGPTTQPAMTLPEPSTPSTSPPVSSRLVLRVTGAPQLPPAGCTAASSTVLPVELDTYPHNATVCPAGVTATTILCPELGVLPPWPRSVACQVVPFVLVHTSTFELPHDPGNETGDDHVAASAGSAGEIPKTAAPASAARAPRPIHLRDRVRD